MPDKAALHATIPGCQKWYVKDKHGLNCVQKKTTSLRTILQKTTGLPLGLISSNRQGEAETKLEKLQGHVFLCSHLPEIGYVSFWSHKLKYTSNENAEISF